MDDLKTNLIGILVGSEFGILNNHFLCLDPRFKINIDKHRIELRETLSCVENFFGEKVSIVTAIVGKNGVGKSTTLKYIKELFIKENRQTEERENDIIFFKDGNKIKIFLEQSKRNQYQISNHTQFEDEVVYFRNYPKIFDRIKNFNTIFYSNSLENDPYEKETLNYYNVSTGFLKETIGKINSRISSKKIRSLGGQKRFRYTELKRQTELLNALEESSSPPKIPFQRIKNIAVDLHVMTDLDYKNLEKIFEAHLKQENGIELSDQNNRKLLEALIVFIRQLPFEVKATKIDSFNESQFFTGSFYESLFSHLIKVAFDDRELLRRYGSEPEFGAEVLDAFKSLNKGPNGFPYFDELLHQLHDLFKKDKEFTGRFNQDGKESTKLKSHALIEKLSEIIRFEGFMKKNWKNFDYRHVSLSLPTRSELFKDFFDNYYGIALDMPFLSFRWPSLSAGEESLISYFSRLYSVLNDINNRNILMLIDEGDLYFHPEWQRDYIFYLLEFLNSKLLASAGIQIIITTHSPFIISDLPKENIILLTKHDNGSEEFTIKAREMEENTFAGNLHSLFSQAFFLGDSATSQFAKNKILREIVEPIESGLALKNKSHIERLINLIGEPVLQQILKERLERSSNG